MRVSRVSRLLFGLGRLCVVLFILLSSIFCLLAYIPFTYQQVVKGGLLPPLTQFAILQPRLYWLALLIAGLTMISDLRSRKTRWLAIAFLAVHAAAGIILNLHPVLASLRNEVSSFVWSEIILTPLLWIALMDWIGYSACVPWAAFRKQDDLRIFYAALASAVFLALVYTGVFYFRATVHLDNAQRVAAFIASLASHAVVFFGLFTCLHFIRAIAGLTPTPSKTEFLLCNAFTGGAIWAILKILVFLPVSFEGRLSAVCAFSFALCLIASFAGVSVRLWREEERGPAGGLILALRVLTPGCFSWRAAQPIALAVIAGMALLLAVNTAVMDWNYLFQKLTVLIVWTLTFACIYRKIPNLDAAPVRRMLLLFTVVLTMIGYRLIASAVAPRPELGSALEQYAGFDVSFRIVRDMLSPPPKDDTFYKFLRDNTNIPRSVNVDPVDLELAGKLTPTAEPKPNIFIFVVDSLRRDYLSPFNPAVTFTPEIGAFARESVAFQNAFTHYGGTGLSEPSIWVGGMLVHKQYVTPFHPMNSLEKLVDVEKFQPFISMDAILRAVMKPIPSIVEMDENRPTMQFEFCRTVTELENKITGHTAASPIFSYTQSQNIHVSVINRSDTSATQGSYPGFYAPYAARLQKIDACLGGFVRFLKQRGLYDNSMIVITADHGDSLGEEGRWGHAYSLVPEIVRIPLIIHLPKRWQALYHDPKAVAFLTDIAPTIYHLLGHKSTLHNEVFGRPLFTERPEEQTPYLRDSYLIAASYAAVYGVLSDNGKSLYVADGVNSKDYYYDLTDKTSHSRFFSSTTKARSEKFMRERIAGINSFYKFRR